MRLPTRARGLLTGVLSNSALRGITVGAKSLFMFALAVWLEPAELGYFGLITAVISFTEYLFGLDFYTFTVRDISTREPTQLRRKLRDQFVLHGLIYAGAALASWWWLPALGLERRLLIVVILLAVTQHITLELYRVLVRLHRVMTATVTFFIRDAAWIPLCLLFLWRTGAIDLNIILAFWLLASVAGAVLAAGILWQTTEASPSMPVDWRRLRRGLRVGLRMLPGTLSMRTLFSVDRMILAILVAPDVLGAYVFFIGICMTFHGLFVSGVLTYFWPALLEAERHGQSVTIAEARTRLFRACAAAPFMVTLPSLAVGLLAAQLLPDSVYGEQLTLLAIAALAHGLLAASNGPHYILFSKEKDSTIVGSHLIGLATFGGTTAWLHLVDLRLAVPLAVLTASLTVLATKGWFARRLLKKERPALEIAAAE